MGVLDTSVFPIRGQTILVRAPQCNDYYTDTTSGWNEAEDQKVDINRIIF